MPVEMIQATTPRPKRGPCHALLRACRQTRRHRRTLAVLAALLLALGAGLVWLDTPRVQAAPKSPTQDVRAAARAIGSIVDEALAFAARAAHAVPGVAAQRSSGSEVLDALAAHGPLAMRALAWVRPDGSVLAARAGEPTGTVVRHQTGPWLERHAGLGEAWAEAIDPCFEPCTPVARIVARVAAPDLGFIFMALDLRSLLAAGAANLGRHQALLLSGTEGPVHLAPVPGNGRLQSQALQLSRADLPRRPHDNPAVGTLQRAEPLGELRYSSVVLRPLDARLYLVEQPPSPPLWRYPWWLLSLGLAWLLAAVVILEPPLRLLCIEHLEARRLARRAAERSRRMRPRHPL